MISGGVLHQASSALRCMALMILYVPDCRTPKYSKCHCCCGDPLALAKCSWARSDAESWIVALAGLTVPSEQVRSKF
jgi:hypothetical protein